MLPHTRRLGTLRWLSLAPAPAAVVELTDGQRLDVITPDLERLRTLQAPDGAVVACLPAVTRLGHARAAMVVLDG